MTDTAKVDRLWRQYMDTYKEIAQLTSQLESTKRRFARVNGEFLAECARVKESRSSFHVTDIVQSVKASAPAGFSEPGVTPVGDSPSSAGAPEFTVPQFIERRAS
jgi:hypothetical protein